ncbi:hypothetical protein [Sphingomonas sp.]|uniref:hypothetical protein n=1 Tax=Sphingomonas sp. TaxID=28214 RepID=UPI003AFF6CEA
MIRSAANRIAVVYSTAFAASVLLLGVGVYPASATRPSTTGIANRQGPRTCPRRSTCSPTTNWEVGGKLRFRTSATRSRR